MKPTVAPTLPSLSCLPGGFYRQIVLPGGTITPRIIVGHENKKTKMYLVDISMPEKPAFSTSDIMQLVWRSHSSLTEALSHILNTIEPDYTRNNPEEYELFCTMWLLLEPI